jgi:hypothetical protein
MSSSILHSGLMQKAVNKVAPVADAGLVLLLRQALAEWARVVKGYERQLHGLTRSQSALNSAGSTRLSMLIGAV